MDRFPRSDSIVQPRAGLQTYMAQVYGWMTVGLLLTAFVAWYAANSAAVMELLFTNRVFLIGLIIAQLALVIVLSAMIQKLSAGLAHNFSSFPCCFIIPAYIRKCKHIHTFFPEAYTIV